MANVVRSFLGRWLAEFEEVQAFCVAMPHHGGSGACYVALKKSEQAKTGYVGKNMPNEAVKREAAGWRPLSGRH
ncbi:Probable DNA endonuclease SmrA [Cedecea neteri]|uniref:Probable DNA endonuclease SmrA n=1 Tax=Cedecea neteri TaxID=158822 RepID=A0A2X3L387_9ENTR|nr:Probable DNA endonuclease SmrA [Cedecea neteri]